MLYSPNNIAPDFGPVDFTVHLFIQKTTYHHIFASYQVEPMGDFFTVFRIIMRSDDAFDGVFEDEVCQLGAGKKRAGQSSAVCCEDQDFL